MSLTAKLLLVFVAVTAVLALPTGYATMRLAELQSLAVAGRGEHAAASLAIGRFDGVLSRLDLYTRSFLSSGSPAAGEPMLEAAEELRAQERLLREAGFPAAASAVEAPVGAIGASIRQLELLGREGRLADATSAFRRVQPFFELARSRVSDAAALVDERAAADFLRAEEITTSARSGTLLAFFLALLAAGLTGIWATGIFTEPLRRLSYATADVADGDFDAPHDLPYDRDDEIGDLSRSFRAMTIRLAELDRMKAEFIGVASHELKTPINVIMGYAELIDEELAESVSESQHEILHAIAEQCQTMTRLVSRLMDISRLEAGAYELQLEEVHLQDLLTGLQRSQELLARKKGITLSTRIEASAPRTLLVDVDIVRDEILGNLVSNALRITPEGGEVRIRVRAEPDSGLVVFRVTDTGPGIPAKHRDHIFDRYYQASRTGRVGSGLGLAIVRKMVEAHGGSVEVVDGEGEGGAVFDVALPHEAEVATRVRLFV